MDIGILLNPRSGRGKAKLAASRLDSELAKRGHKVQMHSVHELPEDLDTLRACDRLVVVGGDGTMHHLLTLLCELQIPAYHLATGTANLIAKHFKMSNAPKKAADNLEREHPPRMIDVPTANGTKFLMMLSLGIDASVIHRFEASRANSGGYRAYTSPIIAELMNPRPARVSIEDANGHIHEMKSPGIAVIANMPAYAMSVNPCRDADSSDGQLDARFVRARSSVRCAARFALMRLRFKPNANDTLQSTRMVIRALGSPCPVQIDGENPMKVSGLDDGFLKPGGSLTVEGGEYRIPIHAGGRV